MMAYRKKTYKRKPKITMGKKFRTKKGKYGCYKYVNGYKVAFVAARKVKPFRNRSSRFAGYPRSRRY